MKLAKCAGLAALAVSTIGCGNNNFDTNATFQHLTVLNDQQVAVHRHDGPDAIVSSNGDLSINGKNLIRDQQQKDLAVRYFSGATALRRDGFATGMAGASTAMTALSSVASNLASGNPDNIGRDVEAKAANIKVLAQKVCSDLRELASTQNALAALLPDFQPYALIDTKTVAECHA